jgi:two-component system NtrC family sensor kinase
MSTLITQEQEIQTLKLQLQQQQRFVLEGYLAAITAHEINNAIMIIIGTSEQLADMPVDKEARKAVKAILSESRRIAKLMDNSLRLIREPTSAHKLADISDIVHTTLSIVAPVLKCHRIHVDIQMPKELPLIMCQYQEIQQALVNLLINACHALNKRYAGYDSLKIIRIITHVFEKDSLQHLRITVEDNGIGIAPEVLPDIFRAGLTTKDESSGTGLGLAICREIADAHRGTIWAESELGIKTRFHLELPVYDTEETTTNPIHG